MRTNETKRIVIKFRNFLDQTHCMVIKPKSYGEWHILLRLRFYLLSAIEYLGDIDTIRISVFDLMHTDSICIRCYRRDKKYIFSLPYSWRLKCILNSISNNMMVSKLIDVNTKVKIGDEVDEYCYLDMRIQVDISSMYPITSFKSCSPLYENAVARLSESDCILEPRPKATKCIFNGPATIVFWDDGTKTVVKCQNEDADVYSEESGVALCFMKKMLGNNGNYNNVLNELIEDGLGYWG